MNNIKTALITGANKGIGLATVEGLAKQGYRVWLGSRDFSRGQAAVDDLRSKGLDVYLLMIDVADDSSVIQAARTLNEHTPHLNILINNAGVAPNLKSLPSEESMNLIRKTFETNTFGPIRVTQTFLPLLKAADQARVIMLSSIVGSIGLSSDPNVILWTSQFHGLLGFKSNTEYDHCRFC